MPRWRQVGRAAAALALAALAAGVLPAAAQAAAPTVSIIQNDTDVRQAKLKFSGITDTGTVTVTLSCDGLLTESDALPYAATMTVSLDLPGCEGYGVFDLWVTVYDDGSTLLQESGGVSISPKLTIEMPTPAETGHTFTFRPRYPDDYQAPADAWCRYEFRWGNDQSLLNNYDETFGALGFDARVVDGNCPTWTFTLPWVPYPQFELYLSVGRISAQESEWWDDAYARFDAAVEGTNPRITASNLPMAQVLPSTYTPIVGQPITYTRYLIAGAKPGSSSTWTAWQGQGDHPNVWHQEGGATFTITPREPGDVVVQWQRMSGSFLYAMFDPPVRYRDRIRPTTTAPIAKVSGGVGTTVPVTLTWTGRDVGWGIARYQLERSLDGGAWKRLLSSRTKTLTQALMPGHAYRYRVRAIDQYGNVGAWTYGGTFRPTLIADGAAAVRYGGSWQVAADPSATGGALHESDAAGAWARLTFTGRAFAWIAERGPGHGRARVYVDGALLTTVDLTATADSPLGLVVRKAWTTAGQHVVKIVVVGTPGRPTVDVDGFVVLR